MNPAHVSTFHAPFAVPTNFIQRIVNTHDYLNSHFQIFKWVDREAPDIGRKYFGSDAPDSETLMRNTSLLFVNGHFTTDLERPLMINFVNIGGIHLVQPKLLPKDIEQFINDSSKGVIFFTFGSTIKMDTAPAHLQKVFVETLGELPQRVLWKYENRPQGESLKNVMIKKWFSQRDILKHKNMKLFISHGGMFGIYEAIDNGVPILGIPLYFDQPHNIANVVHWEAGMMFDHKTLTKDILVKAFKEMTINYTKYKLNSMELSRRFKDRPKTPKEEIIYWTEYVIKHKGAHHLKSAVHKFTRYQSLLIDILITVAVIILFSFSFIFFTLKMSRNRG